MPEIVTIWPIAKEYEQVTVTVEPFPDTEIIPSVRFVS
jgi:hypothetical protein